MSLFTLGGNLVTQDRFLFYCSVPRSPIIHSIHIRLIIINGALARSVEPVVTECKEHTIHTQTQVVASRKPKEIKRTNEGEADFTT